MTAAWVLVLTIVTGDSAGRNRSAAIATIDGFSDYRVCLAAGEKWGRAQMERVPPGTQMTASCLNKSGPQLEPQKR